MWLYLLACTGSEEESTTIDVLLTNGTIQVSSTETREAIGIQDGRFVEPANSATQTGHLQGNIVVRVSILILIFWLARLFLITTVGGGSMNVNKVGEYVSTTPDVVGRWLWLG